MTPDEATALKQRLWNGESFTLLAAEFNIEPYTVQAVFYGLRHARALWPDGSTGAMGKQRRAEIRAIRREALKEIQSEISERTQALLSKKARQRKSK